MCFVYILVRFICDIILRGGGGGKLRTRGGEMPPDTSGRLGSFSGERRRSRALPRSSPLHYNAAW